MSDSYYHSISSQKIFGGDPEDYIPIHSYIDRGRNHTHSDYHRIFTHHTLGVCDAIEHFGPTITNSRGRKVPTRLIAEQHLVEDLGFIPTPDEILRMFSGGPRSLTRRSKLLMSKGLSILNIGKLMETE